MAYAASKQPTLHFKLLGLDMNYVYSSAISTNTSGFFSIYSISSGVDTEYMKIANNVYSFC